MLLFRIVSLSAATDRNRPDPRPPRHCSLARSETLNLPATRTQSFLYVLALLTAPTRTRPGDVLSHLSDLSTHLARLSSSLTRTTPPSAEEENTRLRAEVHARYFTPQEDLPLLATQQPPRPVRALSLPASLNQTAHFVRDLGALARVWRWWDEEEGKEGKGGEGDGGEAWRRVERWARRCAGRRGSESVPYVRSLQQVRSERITLSREQICSGADTRSARARVRAGARRASSCPRPPRLCSARTRSSPSSPPTSTRPSPPLPRSPPRGASCAPSLACGSAPPLPHSSPSPPRITSSSSSRLPSEGSSSSG